MTLRPLYPSQKGYSVRKSDLSRSFAEIAFFLVFPSYFFYQVLAAEGLIRPVFGGYFTAGVAFALPFTIMSVLLKLPNARRLPLTGYLFFAFLVIFLIQVVLGIIEEKDTEITSSHLAYIFKFVGIFFVILILHGQEENFLRRSKLMLVAMSGTIFFLAPTGIFSSTEEGGFQLDYQTLAFVYVVLFIYCAPALRISHRIILYCLAAPSLFFIGARSEFVGFLLLIFVFEFCASKSKPVFVVIVSLALPLLIAAYLLVSGIATENRMLHLLNPSEDQSVIERLVLFQAAIETIKINPITGAYASYEPGQYVHNILSAWVDLGIVGFLVLILVVFMPGIRMAMLFRRHSGSLQYKQTAGAIIFLILLLGFAKYFTYQMVPVALAMYCKYYSCRISHFQSRRHKKFITVRPAGVDKTQKMKPTLTW